MCQTKFAPIIRSYTARYAQGEDSIRAAVAIVSVVTFHTLMRINSVMAVIRIIKSYSPVLKGDMFKHFLVPTDGSALSRKAISRAVTLAKEVGAKITFFYARPDYPVAFYGEGALIDPTTPEKFAEIADQQAQDILQFATAEGRAAGVDCNGVSDVSDVPYEAIIKASEAADCDLIFMASHGRRGITGLLLGSETQKVLTHSRTPVLVYR
jgi:nucleotide-binding universal stress UspA family protein